MSTINNKGTAFKLKIKYGNNKGKYKTRRTYSIAPGLIIALQFIVSIDYSQEISLQSQICVGDFVGLFTIVTSL